MLTRTEIAVKKVEGRYAIIAATYNQRFVDGLLEAARITFEENGVKNVKVFRVPGAFEIPVMAAKLARHSRPGLDALICLAVVLRGETIHADTLIHAVSHGLVTVQLEYELPVIHGVLLCENEQQAEVRCLEWQHNRGREAVLTAVHMADLMRSVMAKPSKKRTARSAASE